MKRVVIFTSIILSFVLLFTISQSVASAPTIGTEKKDKPTEQSLEKTVDTSEATLEAQDDIDNDKISKEDRRATQEAKKATQQQAQEDRKATHKPEKTDKPGKPEGKRVNLKGTIAAVSNETITLTIKDGSSVVIALSAETTVKIPSKKGATLADLQTGMQAAVHAVKNEETLLALSISVVPAKPTKLHRVGIVTEYSAGSSITIQGKDGSTSTYIIDPEVKILPLDKADTLGVGSKVTIISPRDPSGTSLVANGIIIHPQDTEDSDADE